MALGPHSMFADAQDIAALQGAVVDVSFQHSHAAPMDGAMTVAQSIFDLPTRAESSAAMVRGMDAPTPPRTSTLRTENGVRATPPSPAGFAGDAIATIAIPRIQYALLARGSLLPPEIATTIAPRSILLAPEPPPPRVNST